VEIFINTQVLILKKAAESIYIIMYYIKDYRNRRSKSCEIIRNLIGSHKKGVKIYIIVEGSEDNEEYITKINKKVSGYLRRRGIYIKFDTKYRITHAKFIVIDRRYVICSSANWTEDGLSSNQEAGIILRSEKIAEEFIKYFRLVEEYKL